MTSTHGRNNLASSTKKAWMKRRKKTMQVALHVAAPMRLAKRNYQMTKRLRETQWDTMRASRKYRTKKTAKKAIANGCRSPLAVWAESGLKPGGCRPYSLDGRITLGSCMTAEFSSHSHTEPPLASQICHQTTLDVALPIEKFCCHQRSVKGDRKECACVERGWKCVHVYAATDLSSAFVCV